MAEENTRLAAVARRSPEGSLGGFFRDLRAMLSFRTLKAAAQDFIRDDAFGLAAQLSYYLILALFPFILVLVSLMSLVGNPALASNVLGYFEGVMPTELFGLFQEFMGPIISGENPAPGLLSFGILFTLWSASGAFAALINALNKAYDVEETRPFWKVRGIAVLMTLGLSVLIVFAVVLLVLGPSIGSGIAGIFGLSGTFEVVWNVVRWPVALGVMVLAVALLFYFGPDAGQPFRWITPGGLIGVLLWLLASAAFSLYVNNFGSYDETYGSIGVVIVLLLYLYIASLTILFGATLNATLIRLKEELSGEKILDAEPADDKPSVLEQVTDSPEGDDNRDRR
ncbi:YihY family inner membrane protein [Rubrobacter radiotolerans]|uniref:YihY family inner membrane protein n=1 Tax=Rubrobacter radiotolerans TaxID=42256 RepID=A0A023X5S8_RUBRA|nr:YihY/virulence factor BrkB family protein [Rubrobacter radiotolerans]AHY47419.1 YihY family inner membrane protein [Rubrobacter radiotolerans]MDX5894822.1 YihY/virulence factor BrkB family protein [Rubrobacter radiotolerans]SMC06829.1 membrane protein [Rubrobacter radiotolerans DSM 5868]